ncbi:Na(+)-translocating NADH-quinone reductase subunit C [Chromatiaceae bacterium AAb-1]|nr:Na(+)-translocating NADH-quinone reductase subunit C [Chromatiaceae bacterium AAb-1]
MFKSNDSISKTFFMIVAVCLVCAMIVSTAAVQLRPKQQENKLLDTQVNILRVAGLSTAGDAKQTFEEHIVTKYVDLNTGSYVDEPEAYDYRKDMKDPARSIRLTGAEDIASIRTRANVAPVYLSYNDGVASGQLTYIILPVHGYGLWSTLHSFLALEADARTIASVNYYEHAETPGMGGEVENPRWTAQFPGKKVTDDQGLPALRITKPGSARDPLYDIDGLSGATLTSNGVQHIYTFWMGEKGFGPFLEKFRKGEIN